MRNIDLEHVEETFDITPPTGGVQAEAHKAHIRDAVREVLTHIGEDPDREGLRGTPDRVARMYDELTIGYHTDPVKLVNNALFDVDYDEMVIVKDIDFYSLCEHHLLPFHWPRSRQTTFTRKSARRYAKSPGSLTPRRLACAGATT